MTVLALSYAQTTNTAAFSKSFVLGGRNWTEKRENIIIITSIITSPAEQQPQLVFGL